MPFFSSREEAMVPGLRMPLITALVAAALIGPAAASTCGQPAAAVSLSVCRALALQTAAQPVSVCRVTRTCVKWFPALPPKPGLPPPSKICEKWVTSSNCILKS